MSMYYPRWKDCNPRVWKWEFFTPKEIAQRGTDKDPDDIDAWHRGETPLLFVPAFMDKLEALRAFLDFPMIVSSAFRSNAYNMEKGYTQTHSYARAVDIRCFGTYATYILEDASGRGFLGIGLKQHGPTNKRFVHLDDLPNAPEQDRPRPWIWTYP